MLKKRIVTALLALPVLIAAIWFDQPLPWFTLLMAVWGGTAVVELYTISGTTRAPLLTGLGVLWTVLFIISPHFDQAIALPGLLAAAVTISLIGLLFSSRMKEAFSVWVWTIGGVLYIGWLLSYYVALRGLAGGREWVLLALFTVFACDTAAFFVGRALGKRHLAPHISPGKTWEGAIAGVVGAIAASLALTAVLRPAMGYGQAAILGLLVSIFAQLGDLIESILKRSVGVKDSGRLMPGHGGVLDRTDSIVFSGVVVYYYIMWVVL